MNKAIAFYTFLIDRVGQFVSAMVIVALYPALAVVFGVGAGVVAAFNGAKAMAIWLLDEWKAI